MMVRLTFVIVLYIATCNSYNVTNIPMEVITKRLLPFTETNALLAMSNVQSSWRDKCKTELIERSVPIHYLCHNIASRMSHALSHPETLTNFGIGLTPEQSARLEHQFYYLNDLGSYLRLFMIDPRIGFDFLLDE